MEQQDLERIARLVARELGAGDSALTIEPDRQPDRWRITVAGRPPFVIRAGKGTTAQHVREQIYDQWRAR